jgi:hypothetical protein
VSAELVECGFCGYANDPADDRCRECGRSLRGTLSSHLNVRARSTTGFAQMVGGVKPTEGPVRPTGVSRGRLAVGAVAVVALILVATVLLWYHGYLGGPGASPSGSRLDLCQSPPGPNCQGYTISLPFLEEGRETNVSLCDSIVPGSGGQRLELSYSTTVPMYGDLIPSVLYWGSNVSFSANPAGFLSDSAAVAQAAWDSGLLTGSHSIDVPVPSTYPQWCLAWYDPGSNGLVSFSSDAVLAG